MKIIQLTIQPTDKDQREGVIGIRADLFVAAYDDTVYTYGSLHDTASVDGTRVEYGNLGMEGHSVLVKESVEDVLRDFRQA